MVEVCVFIATDFSTSMTVGFALLIFVLSSESESEDESFLDESFLDESFLGFEVFPVAFSLLKMSFPADPKSAFMSSCDFEDKSFALTNFALRDFFWMARFCLRFSCLKADVSSSFNILNTALKSSCPATQSFPSFKLIPIP